MFLARSALAVGLVIIATAARAQRVEAGTFVIDPAESEVHWRIYRAGTFARFGHNHVISWPAPAGTVEVASEPPASQVEMVIDVGDLVIDNPELRARYGEDFSSEPTQEDIEGTRNNMLGEQVLQAEAHPSVTIRGGGLTAFDADAVIDLEVELLGRSVSFSVPVDVVLETDSLTAKAQFRLTHEDLGMEPFSVMLGALQVADEMDFTIDVKARRRR
jgi:hypothetical protein